MNNPSLREEPRNKVAEVIPSKQEVSILAWLESTGRLIERDSNTYEYRTEDLEELSELMVGDDGSLDYDDDDDDILDDADDEE